jgi:hypothetical protein
VVRCFMQVKLTTEVDYERVSKDDDVLNSKPKSKRASIREKTRDETKEAKSHKAKVKAKAKRIVKKQASK